jgi:hypothetical protein
MRASRSSGSANQTFHVSRQAARANVSATLPLIDGRMKILRPSILETLVWIQFKLLSRGRPRLGQKRDL